MAILWYIGPTTSQNEHLIDGLTANFALRKFRSVESLLRLFSVIEAQNYDHPFAIAVHESIPELALSALQDFSARAFSETTIVVVSPSEDSALEPLPSKENPQFYRISAKQENFIELHLFFSSLSQLHRKSKEVNPVRITYKDVTLDYGQLEYKVEPCSKPEKLSMKEAQLLRFFLCRPRKCLSREEIRKAVWDDIALAPRSIDSQVSKLRSRLKEAEVEIESIYGGGYMLA